ncbi:MULTISPECIES: ribonuclease P protein component [unclassified Butyrivibrio]|jgi:ribonuclease P protein component|uniref:ribonuclease P protein component n=1 Tax=unclassified Butyrivibrio TaxID=2639466 RepID=UPI000412337C|nr:MULTISPECIES: ribonuclease P protein component [unclassified Butyrivibrio]
MIKTESLKKTADFHVVYKTGKSYVDKNIVVYVRENGLKINRLGISASKKVGNSVVRHRFARLVRESYRLHENIFNSGLDIVVVARSRAKDAGFFEIEKSFLYLAGKSHLRKNDEVNYEENTDISD